MKKLLIFLTASLSVSAMVLYMYNTASAALTEGSDFDEDTSGGESNQQTDSNKAKPMGKKGGLQESAVQRDQDPDTHSAAKAKVPSTTDEEATGNVD